jgi:hypothetical protein
MFHYTADTQLYHNVTSPYTSGHMLCSITRWWSNSLSCDIHIWWKRVFQSLAADPSVTGILYRLSVVTSWCGWWPWSSSLYTCLHVLMEIMGVLLDPTDTKWRRLRRGLSSILNGKRKSTSWNCPETWWEHGEAPAPPDISRLFVVHVPVQMIQWVWNMQ